MICREATKDDLSQLKNMFTKITNRMNSNGINIWNDFYPTGFFEKDIENKGLFVLEKDGVIVAAFALWNENDTSVQWQKGKALFFGRFGVHIDYLKQGIGTLALSYAKEIAKEKNMNYLRLYVVDINQPAIHLYLKNGFRQVEGIRIESFDDGFELREYGFELEL